MRLLAIESSCDETAAAVISDRPEVLSDVISTQVQRHAPFGGVVPEIASREHLAAIALVVREALDRAGSTFAALDAIAVTAGPGLIGPLFVGVEFAKGLSLACTRPLIAVNHLLGHLAIFDLLTPTVPYPHVALLASGGHTALYRVDSPTEAVRLGTTLDDAAGEAFDKTAKMLGLAYPGGAELARYAENGRRTAVALPVALNSADNVDFSFSGLKTAVSLYLQKHPPPWAPEVFADVCASIESAIVTALVSKAKRACVREGCTTLLLAGGVAANSYLRLEAERAMAELNGKVFAPTKRWCTDNAVMIGMAGWRLWRAGQRSNLAVAPQAYWPFAR